MTTLRHKYPSEPHDTNRPSGDDSLSQSSTRTALVSIIVPVYNEFYHVAETIDRIIKGPMPREVTKEIIVIDDGSTDGTNEVLQRFKSNGLLHIHHSPKNFGKGNAIRTGLQVSRGDIVVFQDGDNEYNPDELERLVKPILHAGKTVVYGSRFMGSVQGMRFRYRLVNRLLVWAVRILYGVVISDEATAFKAFRGQLIRALPLNCERFEFCPEVTAKVSRLGHEIYEVPISYSARTKEEGKKITFRDAVEAFWTLIRYRFWRPHGLPNLDKTNSLPCDEAMHQNLDIVVLVSGKNSDWEP